MSRTLSRARLRRVSLGVPLRFLLETSLEQRELLKRERFSLFRRTNIFRRESVGIEGWKISSANDGETISGQLRPNIKRLGDIPVSRRVSELFTNVIFSERVFLKEMGKKLFEIKICIRNFYFK